MNRMYNGKYICIANPELGIVCCITKWYNHSIAVAGVLIAIVMAIALVIGVLILTIGVVYLKR